MTEKPQERELEISIFGPGYGESIVIHLGYNNWMIVDSCIDTQTRKPIPVEYLESINVDPETAVKRIVASHWHGDHIRGMSDIVKICKNATFCLSDVFKKKNS